MAATYFSAAGRCLEIEGRKAQVTRESARATGGTGAATTGNAFVNEGLGTTAALYLCSTYTSRLIISALASSPLILRRATVTGSVKRRGPALPGLR
jgi:hypothetical protein